MVTTVPVVGGGDTYLKVVVVPNKVYFLINNLVVGSIALNIPSAVNLLPTWFMTKGSGTQNLELTTDGIGVYQQFITPRIFSNTFLTQ